MNSQLIAALLPLVVILVARTSATDCPYIQSAKESKYYRGKCFYFLEPEVQNVSRQRCIDIGTELVQLPESEEEGKLLISVTSQLTKLARDENTSNSVFTGFWLEKNDKTTAKRTGTSRCPSWYGGNPKCPIFILKPETFCQFDCDKQYVHTVCQLIVDQTTHETTSESTTAKSKPILVSIPAVGTDDIDYTEFGLPITPLITPEVKTTSTSPSSQKFTSTIRQFKSETEDPHTKLDSSTPAYSSYSSIRTSIKRGVTGVTPSEEVPFVWDCDKGFKLVGNRCYKLSSIEGYGEEAESVCLSYFSGKPASVISPAVHTALVELMRENKINVVFIGGKRVTKTSANFTWLNGEYFDTNRWAQGEPNPTGGDCIIMDLAVDGHWRTTKCDGVKTRVFCEEMALKKMSTRPNLLPGGEATASPIESGSSSNSTGDSSTEGIIDERTPDDTEGETSGHDSTSGQKESPSSNAVSIYASFILLAILILFLLFCLIMKFRSKNQRKRARGDERAKGKGSTDGGNVSSTAKPNEYTCLEEKGQFNPEKEDETQSKLLQGGGSAA